MANESSKGTDQKSGEEPKEPFVSQEDRPEVRLTPDTPIGELRVRDLASILGAMAGKNPNFEVGKHHLKEFFDKPFPEVVKGIKEFKPEKVDKSEIKEFKGEKNEKLEKREKFEKTELKEVKNEKLETGEAVLDPLRSEPDPRIEQLIQTVAGLAKQVGQLADQVEELKKRTK